MRRALLRRLRDDRRGSPAIEFAICAPVMALVVMGLGDMSHQIYVQSLLDGQLQKAARDSALQGGGANTSTIDATVEARVGAIVKNGTWTWSRRSYSNFATARAERYDDTNGNNARDAGECFDDVNGNKSWDADPGAAGQGGADDVTVYSATLSYPRIFPFAAAFGGGTYQSVSAKTVLKNQPYASQATQTVESICT